MEKKEEAMKNKTVKMGTFRIQRYKILGGGDYWVYEVWEVSPPLNDHGGPISCAEKGVRAHSSITLIDGRWYGKLGSRPLPVWMDELLTPMSEDRSRMVSQYHEVNYSQAYELIVQAFPEASYGRKSMGSITLEMSSVAAV